MLIDFLYMVESKPAKVAPRVDITKTFQNWAMRVVIAPPPQPPRRDTFTATAYRFDTGNSWDFLLVALSNIYGPIFTRWDTNFDPLRPSLSPRRRCQHLVTPTPGDQLHLVTVNQLCICHHAARLSPKPRIMRTEWREDQEHVSIVHRVSQQATAWLVGCEP